MPPKIAAAGGEKGCRRQPKKAAWPPKKRPRSGKKSTRSVPSRQGQTFRKESYKVFCPTFCTLQKVGKGRRKAAAGCRRQHKKAALPPKEAARTCKKLPVASFCASETAETGRIANGREQGDHVSRRQGGKGFNWVCAKLMFGCADSRFVKPQISLGRF